MKTSLLFSFLLSSWLLTSTQAKPPSFGRLTIHATDASGQSIKLSTPNLFTFTPTTLGEARLDARGYAVLTIPLSQTQFIDLDVGKTRFGLLLTPNDDLEIELIGQSASTARFSGKGAQAATYLLGTSAVWQHYESSGGKHLLQLDPKGFGHRLDSLQRAYSAFTQDFVKRNSIDKTSLYLLQQKNVMQLLSFKLNYAMAQYNPTDSRSQAVTALQKAVNEVPFDSRLLGANLYEYGFVLSMYVQAGLYAPLVAGKSKAEMTAVQQQLPLLADQQIIRAKYPAAIRTFLRAKNLSEALRQGITPMADSLIASVGKEKSYALYEPVIRQSYAKWQALLPGQTAPNFSGITPKGDILSLTSLKGKVVYVDVWATWCVPCREEFPEAKQLQKRFTENNQVAFLYVSIDRDVAAWQKFLSADTDFKGVHINQPPGEHFDSLWNVYQLSSIPRYMLIDQAGKLVDVNAARPSSGKIADEIERLLH